MADNMDMTEIKQRTGFVFDIQRYSLQDGPGIRTTVFLKGCLLRCLWCHNPESMERGLEISYQPERCIGCGRCADVCPNHCHTFMDGVHHFDRTKCVRCGLCARECYAKSLEALGREQTAESVIAEVMKDKIFYENSGGGMTVSGGEPTFQFEFTQAILRLAKENSLHTCVETNGYAAFEKYEKIMKFVDIFLFDYKETDPELHKKYTGVDNRRILENLLKLDAQGCVTYLRCPIIPGLNDRADHFAGIAETANRLRHVQEIDIEPYHPLGISKSHRLGREPLFAAETFASDEAISRWIEEIQTKTKVPVKRL
jgi:pyruvate formate lyase activating enzyme